MLWRLTCMSRLCKTVYSLKIVLITGILYVCLAMLCVNLRLSLNRCWIGENPKHNFKIKYVFRFRCCSLYPFSNALKSPIQESRCPGGILIRLWSRSPAFSGRPKAKVGSSFWVLSPRVF